MSKKTNQHRDKCLELAAATIAEYRTLNTDGTASIRMTRGEPDFRDVVELVGNSVDFQTDVPDLVRKKIVSSSFFEVAKEPQQADITAAKILTTINEQEKAYRRHRKTPHFLNTQISIDVSENLPRRIKWDNAVIAFYRQKPQWAPTETDYGTQLRSLNIHQPCERWYYANVFVDARDEYEAADLAFRAINLVRATWNLENNLRLYSRSSSPTQKPLNSFRLGPLQTAHPKNGPLEANVFWLQQPFVSSDYPGRGWTEKNRRLSDLRATEKWVKRRLKNCSYKTFIEGNLLNYVDALDHEGHSDVFPALWTVTESLTGCGRDGVMNYDKLVRRAANAFERPHAKEIILEHLRSARNQMVHELTVRTDETSMFQLMRVVHGLLLFHLRNSGLFRRLDDVFDYLDLPDDEAQLRRTIRLRQFALRGMKKQRGNK
jgi:hypothetical protein